MNIIYDFYDMTKNYPGNIQILRNIFIEIHISKQLLGHITLHIVVVSEPQRSDSAIRMYLLLTIHSVPECGFEGLKCQQAPAQIWDLPRSWKLLFLIFKIIHRCTFGLSHQIKGPTTVKVAKTGFFRKKPIYTCRIFNLM